VGLDGPLLRLGASVARAMVEIFKDIAADNELFTTFSLITAAELPEYARIVTRLEVAAVESLPDGDRTLLTALALRLIPARHRLGGIDDAFMAGVVTARRRFAESLPPALAAGFAPYDRTRYFVGGTLLENVLFGKVVATSSLAVKKVNAIVDEVIARHGLRDLVMETGLDFHVGLFGNRLAPLQRQKMALARALVKRPQVLVLDEALAALEPEKRPEMHQRLTGAMKGRTLVAVVERLDLARHYDRVVVLEEGRVAEMGPYPELAGRDGALHRLLTQAGLAP
jgi:ABC-type thiamine transport system ATPase subunit